MTRFSAAVAGLEDSIASLSEKNRLGWFRNPSLLAAALTAMADLCAQARTADLAGDEVAVSNLIRQVLNVMAKTEAAAGALDG